jgi:hypothetical protein
MIKIMIEVELPEYKIKYCCDSNNNRCKYLIDYDHGFKQYCVLSNKQITRTKDNGNRVCRPYGCRCIARKGEEGVSY